MSRAIAATVCASGNFRGRTEQLLFHHPSTLLCAVLLHDLQQVPGMVETCRGNITAVAKERE